MTKEQIQALAGQIFDGYDNAAPTTDQKIRTTLKNIILAVTPAAKVYAYNGLVNDPQQWANIFQTSEVSNEIKNVNGWVIKRGEIGSENFRAASDKTFYRFDVWAFRGFYDNGEDDNSDNLFQRDIDKICRIVKDPKMQKLGFCPDAADCAVDERELLQFGTITGLGGGDEMLHYAEGSMIVRLCPGRF